MMGEHALQMTTLNGGYEHRFLFFSFFLFSSILKHDTEEVVDLCGDPRQIVAAYGRKMT